MLPFLLTKELQSGVLHKRGGEIGCERCDLVVIRASIKQEPEDSSQRLVRAAIGNEVLDLHSQRVRVGLKPLGHVHHFVQHTAGEKFPMSLESCDQRCRVQCVRGVWLC